MKQARNCKFGIYSVLGLIVACNVYGASESAPAAAMLPSVNSLRVWIVRHYEAQLKNFTAQQSFFGVLSINNLTSGNVGLSNPPMVNHLEEQIKEWKSWQPASRLLRYILDIDWSSGAHMRELAFLSAKYAAIGFALWYVIAAIRYHFHKKQKQEEMEQLICLIRKIDAENAQKEEKSKQEVTVASHDSCHSPAA